MNLLNSVGFLLSGEGQAAAGSPPEAGGMGDALFTLILPFGIMILVFYFLLIRPEKKRAKRAKEMLDNIQVADEIVTTGGIIGRVISVKEDTILLETGSDRTKIRILKNAVAENRTVHDS